MSGVVWTIGTLALVVAVLLTAMSGGVIRGAALLGRTAPGAEAQPVEHDPEHAP